MACSFSAVQRLTAKPRIQRDSGLYVRERIAEIVDDLETAAMLSPDTTIGRCGWWSIPTISAPSTGQRLLVDVAATPVEQITETAVIVDGCTTRSMTSCSPPVSMR